MLSQYKLYMKDGAPGDRLWLIDLVAPFGGGKEVFRELREGVFAGRTIKQLVPRPDGKGMQAVEWKALEKKQAT